MARPRIRGQGARKAELREAVAPTDERERGIARGAHARAEIDAIRKQVARFAEAQGWLSDEDVFREVS